MANQHALDQIARSISFEVEAIPQDNTIQLTSTANTTPLNVKIKVRKKHDAGAAKNAVISIPKLDKPGAAPERIRLVSSDQTIMSFNVFMENEEQEKASRQAKKGFFDFFKAGGRTEINDAGIKKPLTPKKIQSSNISNDSKANKKGILGKYKPGGCLDPPFGEDKYAYDKEKAASLVQSVPLTAICDKNLKIVSESPSVYKTMLYPKKKKRSVNNVVAVNRENNDDNNVLSHSSLNQEEDYKVRETFSNSIITYPPAVTVSEQKMHDKVSENFFKKRTSNAENNYRSSVQSSADLYYCPSNRKSSTRSNNEKNIQSINRTATLVNQLISKGDDKLLTTNTSTTFETSVAPTLSRSISSTALTLEGQSLFPHQSSNEVEYSFQSSVEELVTQKSTTPVSDGQRYLHSTGGEYRGSENKCNVTPKISTLNGQTFYATSKSSSTEIVTQSYTAKEVALKSSVKSRPNFSDESRLPNEIETHTMTKNILTIRGSPSQTNWIGENIVSLGISSKTTVESQSFHTDYSKPIPNKLIASSEPYAKSKPSITNARNIITVVPSETGSEMYTINTDAKGPTIEHESLEKSPERVLSKTSTKREPVCAVSNKLICNEWSCNEWTSKLHLIQNKLITLVSSNTSATKIFTYTDDDRIPDKLTAKPHLTKENDAVVDKNAEKKSINVQNKDSYPKANKSTISDLVANKLQSRELFRFDLSVEKTLEGKNELQKHRSRSTPSLRDIMDSDGVKESKAYADSEPDIEHYQYNNNKEIRKPEKDSFKESIDVTRAQTALFEPNIERNFTNPESETIICDKMYNTKTDDFSTKNQSQIKLEPNINFLQPSVDDGFDEPTVSGEISELEKDDLENFKASLKSIAYNQLKQGSNAVIANHKESDNSSCQFKVSSETRSNESNYAETLMEFSVDSNCKKTSKNQKEEKKDYDNVKKTSVLGSDSMTNSEDHITTNINNLEDYHESKDIPRILDHVANTNESSFVLDRSSTAADINQTTPISEVIKNNSSKGSGFADQTTRQNVLKYHESKDFEMPTYIQPVSTITRESINSLSSPNSNIASNININLNRESMKGKDIKIEPKTLSTEELALKNHTKQGDDVEIVKDYFPQVTSSVPLTPFESFGIKPEPFKYQGSEKNTNELIKETSKRSSEQKITNNGECFLKQVTSLQSSKDNFLSSLSKPSDSTSHPAHKKGDNNLLFESEHNEISSEENRSRERISQSPSSLSASIIHFAHQGEDHEDSQQDYKTYQSPERWKNIKPKSISVITRSDSKLSLVRETTENHESHKSLEIKQQNDSPATMPISYFNNSISNEIKESFFLGKTKLDNVNKEWIKAQAGKISDIAENPNFLGPTEEAKTSEIGNQYLSKLPPTDSIASATDAVIDTYRRSESEQVASEKGVVVLDIAFQSYLNSRNERVIKSFDSTEPPKRYKDDTISIFRSTLRPSDAPVNVAVDSITDLSMGLNWRDILLRESKEKHNMISNIEIPTQVNEADAEGRPVKSLTNSNNADYDNNLQRVLSTVYISHMVPLQDIINHLKNDIDALVSQQEMFSQKISGSKKFRPVKISRTVKRCGCLRR